MASKYLFSAGVAALLGFCAGPAAGDAPSPTPAEALFREGRALIAKGAYTAVADAMQAEGQRGREKVARDRIADVETRLSYVIVRPSADWPTSVRASARVTLDGEELAVWLLGVRIPDVGEHAIAATDEGKRAWETRVRVQADA
jgi:hypothetical protein